MAAPLTASWGFETVTADKLNHTTHGSGTTAEKNAITSWPTDRIFFDNTKNKLYKNIGTPSNITWKEMAGEITGTVKMYAGLINTVSDDYLLCDGAAVSRVTYADLFAVIGTTYGNGDSSTTFNVPDYRDKFPRGAGNEPGTKGGADSVTLTISQTPSHNHSITQAIRNHGTSSIPRGNLSYRKTYSRATSSRYLFHQVPLGVSVTSVGSGTAHENRPAFLEILFIIKT